MKNKIYGRSGFRFALVKSIPVLCGYVFMGAAFGILLQEAGYGVLWALLMSIVIYAGTMQYVAITLLAAQVSLAAAAVTTLLVNFRHLVYGLSFIGRFQKMSWRRQYLKFALTDETYALLCGVEEQSGEEGIMFYISLLNHCYWIAGCVLGAVVGKYMTFNTEGIDFVMTALFIVIATDQWRTAKSKIPAVAGAAAGALSIFIFGADNMLIPAVVMVVTTCLLLRGKLENSAVKGGQEG